MEVCSILEIIRHWNDLIDALNVLYTLVYNIMYGRRAFITTANIQTHPHPRFEIRRTHLS